ncbi:MAG: hypothetical protein WD768_11475 [Phycisphaeraceae bacterium]
MALPALGVITKLTPLSGIIADSDDILIATVDAVDPQRPSMVLVVERRLKGESTIERYPILLEGDSEGDPKHVLDRAEKGTRVLLFITLFITEVDQHYQALAFTEGSWFQMMGKPEGEGIRWRFTHAEPFLRRTFKGNTAELGMVVTEVLAKKAAAPAPSPSEEPGLGPTLAGTTEQWVNFQSGESSKGLPPPPKPPTTDPNKIPSKVVAPEPSPAPAPAAPAPPQSSMMKYLGLGALGAGIAVIVILVMKKRKV